MGSETGNLGLNVKKYEKFSDKNSYLQISYGNGSVVMDVPYKRVLSDTEKLFTDPVKDKDWWVCIQTSFMKANPVAGYPIDE